VKKQVLIVDDEKNHRHMIGLHLAEAGYGILEAQNGVAALSAMNTEKIDIILLDLTMDVMDGLTFLSYIRQNGAEQPVVIITANSDAKSVVSAMKLGAADFLTKPVDITELLYLMKELTDKERKVEIEPASKNYKFSGVYTAAAMGKVIDMLSMVAPTDATVLILGESGVGKELIAQSIHENSPRRTKPFIALNVAALNENLVESELFGHIKGAFTGAVSNRKGRVEEADEGTLFLDEVGELPHAVQAKLLRFLQEKSYEPVGSSRTVFSNVRIVAATNQDLEKMVDEGKFRQDLYFRLAVFPVDIPSLRDRTTDIPILTEHFMKKYSERFQKKISKISKGYIKKLLNYSFPGNIRELENLVERSIILAREDTLTEELLPVLSVDNTPKLKELEKENIFAALKGCDGNKTRAAENLGISRRALYYKLKEYNLDE
jgi:two-component system response regulator HydG